MTWERAEAVSQALTTHAVESLEPWMKGTQFYMLEDGSRGFADARKRLASPSVILLAAVGLVLLIACANIAGVLSARSIERQHEMAVRFSLGATRAELVRQALVECAVLALIGASFGLLLARWTIVLLIQLLNDGNLTTMMRIGLDPPVLLASIGASFLASLVFGALPALQGSRPNPINELRQGGFSSGTRRLGPLRRLLVVAQIALSLILLCGAGVLSRTLRNLQTIDLGFEPERVVLLTVNPEADGYSPTSTHSFFTRLLEDASRIPGIDAAAISVVSPLSGNLMVFDVRVPGFTGSRKGTVDYVHIVSPNYFHALGTPIRQGRDFQSRDRLGSPSVAIVNERFASFYWPGQNPIGKKIHAQGLREVIALVKNANYRRVRETAPPTIYLPLSQMAEGGVPSPGMTLLVRTRGNPNALLGMLRQAVLSLDAGVSIEELRTLETQRDYTISTERTMAFLSTMFATLATVIAVVGLAGVIAFGISSRVHEIGVRRALGASGLGVASIFIRETLWLLAGGIVVGLPFARAASRVLEQLVFGLPAWDLQTALLVILLLGVTCLTAVLVPLRRALAIEPAAALRQD